MNKKVIIQTLEKIALYMELLGENHFKVGAFRKAANVLEVDPRSLAEMDDILTLKGIGKGTGAVIQDLLDKGVSDLLSELQETVPAGMIPLLEIPGLGGKRIAKLHEALGIDSIESLKEACEKNEVSALPGFGKKTEEKLLHEIEQLSERKTSFPLWQMVKFVGQVEPILDKIEEIGKYSVAGSYRRTKEQSSDMDFIIVTDAPSVVREKLLNLLPTIETIAAGDSKLSVTLELEEIIDVDFRFVTDAQYASALHHFTGSKEHNVRMRQLAKSRGEKISEYGVEQEDGTVLTFESEEDFFAHFDLPFIQPNLRQDGRELDRINELAGLVTLGDIRGDFHMHTTASDGGYSIREMADACRARGYSHMVITDHSHYLKVANGLTPERLLDQLREIREINEEYPDIEIFSGTEMDILPDGTLDFDDEVLAQLDFVIASIHSSFNQPQEQIMERLHSAMKNPHVDLIAHPTGRLIGKRDGYNPDVPQLIKWAAKYGKVLELNASPHRLDLDKEYLEMAQEAGVSISINTDAHATDQLEIMAIGVEYAQKAWLKKDTVINTWSLNQFKERIVDK
ncbi:DNA polymerase/3'-5' exonuclease PolX [Sporosarcina sp. BI001-red]|uniref:DNA polymerase/3'-5' exonuclease PolX n=1 Tax=Sporosarcina sp. BI001-red TaxID=2282866 RepID=UPI000E287738|nr:DNA polymerase/3'-5' exonuclease PolX [Sporosarcina sp. BI001-red]REB06608.1 DNA polymerase/3'-5' exonuclease PolX [Sporosarcina sp. BI001-red]